MSRGKSFEPIRRELHQQVQTEKGWNRMHQSMEGISRVVMAIAETTGDDWVNRVTDKEGNPLLEENEKKRFREVFRPYLPAIREYLSPSPSPSQHGGQDPPATASPAPPPYNASLTPATPATATATASLLPAFDMDGIFTGMVRKSEELDQFAQSLSSEYGLLKWERDFDQTDDFHVIPGPIRALVGSLGPGGMATKEVLDQIKVPFRLLVFLVYLALDVYRLSAAALGQSAQQRVLSIVLALLELFRGDWKRAILTFMGLYGTTPMLTGQVLKVFLFLFERLSPTLQDRMIYGAWDTGKSLLLGILLSLFQLTAPIGVRQPFMGMLEKLAKGKQAIDQSLEEAGLEPRPDHFAPTWQDINLLQAVNDDPVFVCSCEYEEVMKQTGDSALLRFILQLLRLPVNQDMREKYTCVGRTPCQPYREALIQEQKPLAPPAYNNATPASPSPPSPASATPETPASTPAPPETPASLPPASSEMPTPAPASLPPQAPLPPQIQATSLPPALSTVPPTGVPLPAQITPLPAPPAFPASSELPVTGPPPAFPPTASPPVLTPPLPVATPGTGIPPAAIQSGGGMHLPCFF